MKRIAWSILLIFLLSCRSSSILNGTKIRVEFRDTIQHEYTLLAVRDSGLVVGPGSFDSEDKPKVIPFSNIAGIYHNNNGKTVGMLLGGMIGCTTSLTALSVFGKGPQNGQGVGGALITLGAIGTGCLIGYHACDDEAKYDISNQGDIEALRSFSKYPDLEPLEILMVR